MILRDVKNSILTKNTFKCIGLVLCFIILETIFRIQPEFRIRHVSVLDEVPFLYDFLYSIIFVSIIAGIPKERKKLKRGVYVFVFLFFSFYMLSQYIYCRIFDRVYGLKTLQYANEGGDFAAMVLSYFDLSFFRLLLLFLLVGTAGYFLLPDFPLKLSGIKKSGTIACTVIFCIAGILVIPTMFKTPSVSGGGNYRFKITIYKEWIDNKRAVEMFGAYEFLFRDCYKYFQKPEVSEEDLATISEYFSSSVQKDNEKTGLFEGKNLILVLLESMDDCVINEETTPTICNLMNEGINFTDMYTPIFGSAPTLNSEFCSYTGLIAPADGTPIENYTNNTYSYSLPNLFRNNGYTAKSFHYNSGEYYNRDNLHNSVGFEQYISYLDFEEVSKARQDNTLTENEEIYKKFIEKVPFFNYVITFSAHSTTDSPKPYSHEDEALQIYPEYLGKYPSEEMDSLSAKARLTDDMFAGLLQSLEKDGLLDDTVIIAYADHYAYAMLDQEYLKEVSDAENTYELSKTPFFIWAKGVEPQEITKTVKTLDIYPTICNLFRLDNHGYFLGNDVFDDSYEGYAFWQDGSWISSGNKFYSTSGVYVGEENTEQRQQMEHLISEKLKINQLIMDTDYFAQLPEKY